MELEQEDVGPDEIFQRQRRRSSFEIFQRGEVALSLSFAAS